MTVQLKLHFLFFMNIERYASGMIFSVSPKHREKTWLSQLLLLDIKIYYINSF